MHDVTIFMCISTLYIGGIAVTRQKTELIILAAQVAITPRMQLLCTNIYRASQGETVLSSIYHC